MPTAKRQPPPTPTAGIRLPFDLLLDATVPDCWPDPVSAEAEGHVAGCTPCRRWGGAQWHTICAGFALIGAELAVNAAPLYLALRRRLAEAAAQEAGEAT